MCARARACLWDAALVDCGSNEIKTAMRSCIRPQMLCPDLANTDEIEWTTKIEGSAAAVPYGLIVRIFEAGSPPDYFESPVDGDRFDSYLSLARRAAKAAGDKGPPAA
mmetsp:Transcript_89286/g.238717  ORF Transcript_89286/g.238717 Transcript_89286/m.238717 type:complete len:108 (+) Transcript_89286:2148-2471(+)